MVFPGHGKGTNIVKVYTIVVDVMKYLFHNLLGKVRRCV